MKKMFLDGVVGWDFNTRAVRDALLRANGEDLEIEINSPGGDAHEGIAIFNELSRYPGEITMIGTGIVASAASIIFLAGNSRKVLEGSQYMIHNATFGVMGHVNKETALRMAEHLSKWDATAEKFYAKLTNIENPRQAMINETFYTDDEMLENGIASEIIETTNKKVKEPKAMLDEIKSAWAKGLSKPEKEPIVSIVDTDDLQMVASEISTPSASEDNDTLNEVVSTITDMANAMTKAVETMVESVNAMTTEMSAVREDIKAINSAPSDPDSAEHDKTDSAVTDEPTEEEKAQAAKEAAIEARNKAIEEKEAAIEAREKLVAEKEEKIDNYFPNGTAIQQTNKWGGF
ncbi:Clp protease ClpP [Enterococcus avium]|uniref:Clp protease ClpP n=1 Tax=Enterococcus avium TaxID=33945 RepID=UPI001F5AB406|nr:Clp protease ClpP [Enterococcus avium]